MAITLDAFRAAISSRPIQTSENISVTSVGFGNHEISVVKGKGNSLATRQALLDALKQKFGNNIPKGVLKAMNVSKAFSGFSVDKNGEVKVSNHPLSARRLQTILKAVKNESVNKTAQFVTDVRQLCVDHGLNKFQGTLVAKYCHELGDQLGTEQGRAKVENYCKILPGKIPSESQIKDLVKALAELPKRVQAEYDGFTIVDLPESEKGNATADRTDAFMKAADKIGSEARNRLDALGKQGVDVTKLELSLNQELSLIVGEGLDRLSEGELSDAESRQLTDQLLSRLTETVNLRLPPPVAFQASGLTFGEPLTDDSIPIIFKDRIASVTDNHGMGDCFFYSALDFLSPLGGKSNCKQHAKELREAMTNHAKSILDDVNAGKEMPGIRKEYEFDGWEVKTSNGCVNVCAAGHEIQDGGFRVGVDADLTHGAFLADLLKRPVIILSEPSAQYGNPDCYRFDCDLKSGAALTGDPIFLLHTAGHFRSFEPTPAFLQQLQQP